MAYFLNCNLIDYIAMKKFWVHKANSFKEAEDFDSKYYSAMSGEERLEIMQFLRDAYHKIRGVEYHKIRGVKNESRKGLRRVIKVVQ